MNDRYRENPEVRAARAARREVIDPLAHRQRSAAFWTDANKTNPHYGLVHSRAFYRSVSFRRLLLPRTRAHVQAQYDAAIAEVNRSLRESSERWRLKKALAKAPPLPLFS